MENKNQRRSLENPHAIVEEVVQKMSEGKYMPERLKRKYRESVAIILGDFGKKLGDILEDLNKDAKEGEKKFHVSPLKFIAEGLSLSSNLRENLEGVAHPLILTLQELKKEIAGLKKALEKEWILFKRREELEKIKDFFEGAQIVGMEDGIGPLAGITFKVPSVSQDHTLIFANNNNKIAINTRSEGDKEVTDDAWNNFLSSITHKNAEDKLKKLFGLKKDETDFENIYEYNTEERAPVGDEDEDEEESVETTTEPEPEPKADETTGHIFKDAWNGVSEDSTLDTASEVTGATSATTGESEVEVEAPPTSDVVEDNGAETEVVADDTVSSQSVEPGDDNQEEAGNIIATTSTRYTAPPPHPSGKKLRFNINAIPQITKNKENEDKDKVSKNPSLPHTYTPPGQEFQENAVVEDSEGPTDTSSVAQKSEGDTTEVKEDATSLTVANFNTMYENSKDDEEEYQENEKKKRIKRAVIYYKNINEIEAMRDKDDKTSFIINNEKTKEEVSRLSDDEIKKMLLGPQADGIRFSILSYLAAEKIAKGGSYATDEEVIQDAVRALKESLLLDLKPQREEESAPEEEKSVLLSSSLTKRYKRLTKDTITDAIVEEMKQLKLQLSINERWLWCRIAEISEASMEVAQKALLKGEIKKVLGQEKDMYFFIYELRYELEEAIKSFKGQAYDEARYGKYIGAIKKSNNNVDLQKIREAMQTTDEVSILERLKNYLQEQIRAKNQQEEIKAAKALAKEAENKLQQAKASAKEHAGEISNRGKERRGEDMGPPSDTEERRSGEDRRENSEGEENQNPEETEE